MGHEHHQHNHVSEYEPDCLACQAQSRLSRRTWLWLAAAAALFAVSWLPGLENLRQSYLDYLGLIWWAVLLGLFLGGLIEYFVPEGFVFRFLGGRRLRTLPLAVVAGFIMSACSHGILAIAMQLYKKGASIPATITFLMASPWANLPVTILLFGFFGAQALFFIGGAMLIALTTGLVFQLLEKYGVIEKSLAPDKSAADYHWDKVKNFNLKRSYRGVLRGSVSLTNMVLWWIIIGFIAAVLIRTYVPAHLFTDYLGAGIAGLLLTLAVATVIEVCSEGSAPLAFELFNKVGTLGNPFVFLMAGVATDYTEIGLIWSNIGKRTAIALPIVAVPQILLLGILFNSLL